MAVMAILCCVYAFAALTLISWVAQTFLQLAVLVIIMVGQSSLLHDRV